MYMTFYVFSQLNGNVSVLYFSRYRYMTFNVLSALNTECLRVVFITLYDIQCIFLTK